MQPSDNLKTTLQEKFKPQMAAYNKGKNFVSQYIVTPKGYQGINGLVFSIENEHRIELSSTITDHYVEDNSPIQDHVALQPVKITLSGFVGELVYEGPSLATQLLLQANEKLGLIGNYVPGLTKGTTQAINNISTKVVGVVDYINSIVSTGLNLIDTFAKKSKAPSKQSRYLDSLNFLWQSKWMCTVSTPFTLYNNMIIENITAVQNAETKFWSDFTVTLKEIRFAQVQFTSLDPNKYQGRGIAQANSLVDNGKAQGTVVENKSFLYKQTIDRFK